MRQKSSFATLWADYSLIQSHSELYIVVFSTRKGADRDLETACTTAFCGWMPSLPLNLSFGMFTRERSINCRWERSATLRKKDQLVPKDSTNELDRVVTPIRQPVFPDLDF